MQNITALRDWDSGKPRKQTNKQNADIPFNSQEGLFKKIYKLIPNYMQIQQK